MGIVTGGCARDNSGTLKNPWNGGAAGKNNGRVAAMTQALYCTAAVRMSGFVKALITGNLPTADPPRER
jgi:hypothetical protein